MKIIKNVDELLLTCAKEMWGDKRVNRYSSSDYKDLHYDCGCGEQHVLRDTEYNFIALPVKFIFEMKDEK